MSIKIYKKNSPWMPRAIFLFHFRNFLYILFWERLCVVFCENQNKFGFGYFMEEKKEIKKNSIGKICY